MIKPLTVAGCPAGIAEAPVFGLQTPKLSGQPELPEGIEAPGMLAPWPESAIHSAQHLQLLSCRGGQKFMLLHTLWASSAVWSPGWPLPTWDQGGLCLTSSQADSWRRTHPDSRRARPDRVLSPALPYKWEREQTTPVQLWPQKGAGSWI